jgi:hypothetical protein
MLEWSVDALRAVPDIEHIVVALPPGLTAPHGLIAVPGGASARTPSSPPSTPPHRGTSSWSTTPRARS